MLISENWLREWVDPDLSTQEVCELLTMSGLEVGSLKPETAQFSKVVVAQITSISNHPDSERLKLCSLDAGKGSNIDVVCGAENIAINMNVPLALAGARLPDNFKVENSTIRGVNSQGMICSAMELGLAEKSTGIMQLQSDAIPGTDLADYLQLDDHIIEIELTPNRGDCLSVAGVARELSALTGSKLNSKQQKPIAASTDKQITIDVEAWQGCPRYLGRVIENIDTQAITPDWMKEKLRRSGLRPISAIVDITNFVMLELGQPMHAFDLNNINKGIVVRYAEKGESLTLLDDKQLKLNDDDLLICDHAGPVALAGIMGGLGSGISNDTHSVLLECAYFSQSQIIGKARRIGLQTDASYRYERGVDPYLQQQAVHYATHLIMQICGGQPGPIVEAVNDRYVPEKQPIQLRFSQLNKVLGIQIKPDDVTKYLKRLDCQVEESKSALMVTPPNFRFDLDKEHDLIEEVARLYGYNQIPDNPPNVTADNASPSESSISLSRLRNLMIDRGYSETISYSFVDPILQHVFHASEKSIDLKNPIAENLSQMRLSLIPGLLNSLANNFLRQHRQIQLFELGNIYYLVKKQRVETLMLGGISTGMRAPEQWGNPSEALDFYDIKSDLEAACALAGLTHQLGYQPLALDGFHPGRCANICLKDKTIGFIGQILPVVLEKLDIDQNVYCFQIEAQIITQTTIPQYESTSKFPSTRRDLSIIVEKEIPAAQILNAVSRNAGKELIDLKLFDVYTGKPIDSNKKSVSLGLTFQALERTLTEMEMDEACQRVMKELENKFDAKLRQ